MERKRLLFLRKITWKLFLFLLMAGTGIACQSCSNNEEPFTDSNSENPLTKSLDSIIVNMLPKTQSIELSLEQRALVAKSNDFSFNLYRAIHAANGKNSNITSPLSVTYALGMLNDGAAGNTAKEISQVLGFENSTKQAVNEYCKALIKQAPIIDPSVVLQIANIVAANQKVVLEDNYQKDLKDYYTAEVASLDFSKQSSLDYLNNWCNEKSGGLIPQIINNLSPQEMMVLMNAVYFKATWTEKFDEKQTQSEPFTKADNNSIKLPMMHRKAQIRYCNNDIFTGIWLPFGSGDKWSMKVLLPEEGKTVDDIINSLTNDSWEHQIWQHATVDIKIPRFTTKSDIILNDQIAKLGAPSIFDPQKADFSLISKNQKQLFVSQMKQKATIEVNEEGTKTTAVTVARMEGANLVKSKGDFHANRPFVYIIQEASSGAIFFIGTFQGN